MNPLRGLYKLNRIPMDQYGRTRSTFAIYFAMRLFIYAAIIWLIVTGQYKHTWQAVLGLVFLWVPPLFEKKFQADLPPVFIKVILFFIFAFYILGEVFSFMGKIPWWDTMLHTLYGFIFAAFCFSLLEIFNKDTELKFKMKPGYLVFITMSTTLFISTIWEFFEFAVDHILPQDMQKDRLVDHFQTTFLDETHTNTPVIIDNIKETIINYGDGKQITLPGYLDIGIFDTMKDHFVAFCGAAVFCCFLLPYLRSKGGNKVASALVPVRHDWKAEPAVLRAVIAQKFASLEKNKEDK